MAADLELNWEWPANRQAEQKILVKIKTLAPQGTGIMNINKTPSLVNNLPDPIIVTADILSATNNTENKTVRITVPKLEIESLKEGDYAVFGLVETSTCICIVPVDSADIDLDKIKCSN